MREARQPVRAITPSACGGQALQVDRGLAPLQALEEAGRRQLDQVAVAGVGGGQQRQVVALDPARAAAVAIVHVVDLAAEDRLDPVPGARLVQLDGAVHHPVVGQAQRRLVERGRALGQSVDLARAVQQRVLGVDVQVGAGGGPSRVLMLGAGADGDGGAFAL